MTQDDIMLMAREAGWDMGDSLIDVFSFGVRLERFAALVAAAEREACAKVCEVQGDYDWQQYADAIRARSQA